MQVHKNNQDKVSTKINLGGEGELAREEGFGGEGVIGSEKGHESEEVFVKSDVKLELDDIKGPGTIWHLRQFGTAHVGGQFGTAV